MGSGIEFTIRLKPYLQEWVFNSVMVDPPRASRNDMFGWIVLPYLKRYEVDTNPKFYKGEEYFRFEFVNLNDLGIDIQKGNYVIPDKYHSHVERLLYIIFEREFFHYMDDKVRYTRGDETRGRGGNIKKLIIQWCMDNNLTYEYCNYEMLKKKYYRYKKEQKPKDLFSKSLSLNCANLK